MAEIRLTVTAPGEEPWETAFGENEVPFQVAWKIREHFGWTCGLPEMQLTIGEREWSAGVLERAVAYAPKPHALELHVVDRSVG